MPFLIYSVISMIKQYLKPVMGLREDFPVLNNTIGNIGDFLKRGGRRI